MFSRIMIPLDGSKAAEISLPYAVALAGAPYCQITLVSVSASDASHLYETYLKSVATQLRRQLNHWGNKKCEVRSEVLIGNPAGEIVRFAREGKIGLILMASYGSSGDAPWILGNIATKVLRATDRPVLLVKTPVSKSALESRALVRKVLVPLDGSETGQSALCYAEKLATDMGAEIILIEVYEPVGTVGASGMRDDGAVTKALTTYLDSVAKPIEEQGVKISSVVVFGDAAHQIMKYAEENDVDLIAVSSHGRSGVGRWVFGSVTEKILHTRGISVLVVRASEATCEVLLAAP